MPTGRRYAMGLVLAAACLCAGCGDDDPVGPGEAAPVMALDVGNTWHYALRDNEPGTPLVPLHRTITEHREINHDGHTITVAVEMPVPGTLAKFHPDTGRLLRNEAGGLYDYGRVDPDGTVTVQGRGLVAPRDGRPGERFDLGADRILVCVAADSLVVTDFGEVEADVYELLMDEGTVRVPDIHVVPGVGLTLYCDPQWTAWMTGYDFD